MKIKSYTLAEAVIVVFILGIIVTFLLATLRPKDYKTEAYKKAGLNHYLAIGIATKQLLAKYSSNYNMTGLKTTAGADFSIVDSGADAKLAPLYKIMLRGASYTAPSGYSGTVIKNEAGTAVGANGGYKISDFTQGFQARNNMYFALKLNRNCTTTESYIYDPSVIEKRTAAKSCGLILFDVNADAEPNIAGVDIYIISIGKMGIK